MEDMLVDLARRLAVRGEPDTVELIAAQARNDAQLLFTAADRARDQFGSDADAATVLEDAAVFSLRAQLYGASMAGSTAQLGGPGPDLAASLPSVPEPGEAAGASTATPRTPVVISRGAVTERLDEDTEELEQLGVLLSVAQKMLHFAGYGHLAEEFAQTVDAAVEGGGTLLEVYAAIGRYVTLTD